MREAQVAGTNDIRPQCRSGPASPPGFHPCAGRIRAFALPGLAAFAGPLAGSAGTEAAPGHTEITCRTTNPRQDSAGWPNPPLPAARRNPVTCIMATAPAALAHRTRASGRRSGSSRGFRDARFSARGGMDPGRSGRWRSPLPPTLAQDRSPWCRICRSRPFHLRVHFAAGTGLRRPARTSGWLRVDQRRAQTDRDCPKCRPR